MKYPFSVTVPHLVVENSLSIRNLDIVNDLKPDLKLSILGLIQFPKSNVEDVGITPDSLTS